MPRRDTGTGAVLEQMVLPALRHQDPGLQLEPGHSHSAGVGGEPHPAAAERVVSQHQLSRAGRRCRLVLAGLGILARGKIARPRAEMLLYFGVTVASTLLAYVVYAHPDARVKPA